ncbi:hypothetical protein SDC9_87237 [bioreactor metagenome]|uniref:Uncharacterized protein n=1 Tax=bioreactor metagenome TaxID=1076179 RepID=A0A644ZPI1_9ZZZZ
MRAQRGSEQEDQHYAERRRKEPEHEQRKRRERLGDDRNGDITEKRNGADEKEHDDPGQFTRELDQPALKTVDIVDILKVIGEQPVAEPDCQIDRRNDDKKEHQILFLFFRHDKPFILRTRTRLIPAIVPQRERRGKPANAY